MHKFLMVFLLTLSAFNANSQDCSQEGFKKNQLERIRYDKAIEVLNDFYAQYTNWERETLFRAWEGINSQTLSVADVINNPELKKFGVDAGEWNGPFLEYRDGLIQLSIDKYNGIRKIDPNSYIKLEDLIPTKFYYSLNVGFYKASGKYPVEMIVGSGKYFLNGASKNELLFFSTNYDYATAQIKSTFFVSKIDSVDFGSDFSGMKWFDNLYFFQSLGEYLAFKYALVCAIK